MAKFTIVIPNFHPTTLNKLIGCHWATAAKRKAADREMIGSYAFMQGPPKDKQMAKGKRRVSLHIVLGPRQRAPDPDAFFKSTLDALVFCGVLVDDNRQHVELMPLTFSRAAQMATEIMVEDL